MRNLKSDAEMNLSSFFFYLFKPKPAQTSQQVEL